MNEQETTIITKEGQIQDTSRLLGVSIRGWLALVLVGTVCLNQGLVVIACLYEAIVTKDFGKVGTYTTVGEPLYSLTQVALGFYLGQKTPSK